MNVEATWINVIFFVVVTSSQSGRTSSASAATADRLHVSGWAEEGWISWQEGWRAGMWRKLSIMNRMAGGQSLIGSWRRGRASVWMLGGGGREGRSGLVQIKLWGGKLSGSRTRKPPYGGGMLERRVDGRCLLVPTEPAVSGSSSPFKSTRPNLCQWCAVGTAGCFKI